MRINLLKSLAVVAIAIGLVGCQSDICDNCTVKDTNTYAVVVGMENSRFAGACPGAGYDADRMFKLLSEYTPNIVLFRDSNAVKANVVAALKEAVAKANDGLVIFFYSGHGGSEPFPDTGIDEKDGKDEFLCFYDTYMRDNEVWDIIKQSKGRFFMLADCCHSATMYRAPGFRIIPPLAWDNTLNEQRPFSMLCWSGCPDNTYSYGAATGGQFTNALLRHFDSKKSYEYLWNEIKNDKVLRGYENPQSTALGDGFNGKPVFR